MRGLPEFSIIVRDGKGYPHNVSEQAAAYIGELPTKGIFLVEDQNIANGTVIEAGSWRIVQQYQYRSDEWKFDSEYLPFEPRIPDPGYTYRTVYQLK